MSSTKHQRQDLPADTTKSRVTLLLNAITSQAARETQFDSFYEKAAEQLREADPQSMPVIARTILRAGYREKEILLRVLKYFKGVEHLQFLQDLLSHEVITPRMGRIILEIFNKSDMILEAGTASRLLDLDVLSQNIIHGALSGSIDDDTVRQFVARPDREREGIMADLLDDAGTKSALFIARLFDIDVPAARKCLKLAAAEPTEAAYGLLTDMYGLTGNKEISKAAKKMAHALRQKGILVAEKDDKKPQQPVFKNLELPEPRAFTTMIDAEGFRLLFMLKPISPHEIRIFNTMLNQDTGLADIEAMTALRRESNQLVKNLLADDKIEFVEIPTGHGVFLLLEAAAVTERRGAALSPVLTQWKALFADLLPAPALPAIYAVFNPADMAPETVSESSLTSLFDTTELPFWFIATDFARDFWSTLRASGADPLQQDPAKTADDFFTHARFRAFARRLEELAYMLHLKGKADLSRAAFLLARELAAPALKPSANAFCIGLVRRGLEYFAKQMKTSSPQGQ